MLAAAGCSCNRANGNLANARSPSHSLESSFSRFQAPSSTCWRPACCRACCRRPHRRSNSGRQQAHKTCDKTSGNTKHAGTSCGWLVCAVTCVGLRLHMRRLIMCCFLCGVCIGQAVNRRVLSVWFVRMIFTPGWVCSSQSSKCCQASHKGQSPSQCLGPGSQVLGFLVHRKALSLSLL